MAKLIALKIDVSKIDKSKLFTGKKGTYLDLTVAVNDEKNEYGQDVSAWQSQTKEEREQKASKNYLGNGEIVWSDESKNKELSTKANEAAKELNSNVEELDDGLPF